MGRQIILWPAKRFFWQAIGFHLLRKHNIHSNRKTFVRLKWMDFYDWYILIKLIWLLAVIKEKLFGIFSCIHALMILIYYVNSITALLNICGHYIITFKKLDFLCTLYISYACDAQLRTLFRMKTWFLNKLNQDQIFWYVCKYEHLWIPITIFLHLSKNIHNSYILSSLLKSGLTWYL